VLMSASVKSCQADSAHPLVPGKVAFFAPDLFCVAIDWILDHMGTKPHLEVGGQIFSDLAYANDTAFLFSSEDNIAPCVHSFSQTAATLGLRTSWTKTKLQNLDSGPSPTSLQIDGNGK